MNNPLKQISNKFSQKCCDYYHRRCKEIQNDILREVKKGVTFDNDFLTRYLIYLNSNSNSIYYYYSCMRNTDNWIAAITELCKTLIPTENDMKIIVKGGNLVLQLFQNLIKRGVKIPNSVLNEAISSKGWDLIKLFVNHIEADSKCLELLCNENSNVNSIIEIVINQKIQLTEQALINAINNGKDRVAKLLIQMGCNISENALIVACKNLNKPMALHLLDCRIEPTRDVYRAIIDASSSVYGRNFAGNCEQIAEFIDIIVSFGYKPDYEDVLYALEYKCYINDIERFNIKFKDDFMEKCSEYQCYPYSNIRIKPTLKCLQIECKRTNNLTIIRKLVKGGLKPNIVCLRDACNSSSNVPTIRYLIDKHKLKPDIECIKNIAKYCGNNNLNIILEKWNDDKNNTSNSSSSHHTSNSNHLNNSNHSNSSSSSESLANNELITPTTSIPKPIKIKTKMELLADELDLGEEFSNFNINPNGANLKNIRLENIKIVDKEEENIEENEEPKIVSLEMPENVPKNKRTKRKFDDKYLRLLNITKQKELSFLDLRKYLIDYIKDNDLYDKDIDKRVLIKLNKDMCQLLNIDGGNRIQFNDLDKLVGQFYGESKKVD